MFQNRPHYFYILLHREVSRQAVNFNQNILGKMFMQKRDASHTLMKKFALQHNRCFKPLKPKQKVSANKN